MARPIAVSLRLVMAGMMTRHAMAKRKRKGIARLTLMGLDMSGLVLRNHSMPTTDAPTDSHSVCEK